MKSIKIIILLVFVTLFFSCKQDNGSIINIKVCGVENPGWLITKIDNILKLTTKYRPVLVSVYIQNNMEIISIEDPVNSDASKGLMFFNCDGSQIEFNSDKYLEFSKLLEDGKFKLLWSK